ncbi:MAG: NosD domain-containing protein, partial [Candidatus Hodarchaeales archaeon]
MVGIHLSGEIDVGQVILANCNDSIIEGLEISYASTGIYIQQSFNCSIFENTIIDNTGCGITLVSSCNISIS